MRRLVVLISAVLFLEMLFMAVLSPLLPGLRHELGLSTAQAGVLTAMYAAGAMAGAVVSILVALRVGPKRTMLISLVLFAATSVAFGLAGSYPALLASRFAQGVAGAACWTGGMVWLLEVAPVRHRGEWLGLAFGVSEAGAIAGPVVGGIAASVGRPETFVGVAVLSLVLTLATLRFPAPPPVQGDGLRLRAMISSARVRRTIWAAMLAAALFGAILVLAPLQQHDLGAGAGEIAATFAAAALAGILIRPLYGRWSDRQGPLRAVRLGLLANVPFVLLLPWLGNRWAVALFVCCVLVLVGVLWAPLMVMLSDACLAVGVGQIMAVAVMNLTWPPGNVIGAAGGAAVAQAAGQRWAYAIVAAALLGGFLMLGRIREPVADALAAQGAR
jgi:DHA1 family quinolone resistance protein-like MFS transporter